MEKKKNWPLLLIVTVFLLTLYNILPTLFYYCQPLKSSLTETQGKKLALSLQERVNVLEKEGVDWLFSFGELIQTAPLDVSIHPEQSDRFCLKFRSSEETERFRTHLAKAGQLIPFVPAQLNPFWQSQNPKELFVLRKVPLHLDSSQSLFSFVCKKNDQGLYTPAYRGLILDRAIEMIKIVTRPQESAHWIAQLDAKQPLGGLPEATLEALCHQLCDLAPLFDKSLPLGQRKARSFLQGCSQPEESWQTLISAFDALRDRVKQQKTSLSTEEGNLEKIALLQKKEQALIQAKHLLKTHKQIFITPWAPSTSWEETLQNHSTLSLDQCHPIFSGLTIDWEHEQIQLNVHPEWEKVASDFCKKGCISQIAQITQETGEVFEETSLGYFTPFHQLENTQSVLVFDLQKASYLQAAQFKQALQKDWRPQHPDLQEMPILELPQDRPLTDEEATFSLLICPPSPARDALFPYLPKSSVAISLQGLDRLSRNYESLPHSELLQQFTEDLKSLQILLWQNGFFPSQGAPLGKISSDLIFEKPHANRMLLAATRENFLTRGSQKYAFLELSDVEQRILTQNQIDTQIHNDLLKWHDEYRSSQISLQSSARYEVPKPTRSPFWNNLLVSLRKFVRGDERKIIRWGLDLSGGKTVQIQLCDSNQIPVTDELQLKQGMDELYKRVNKMGVSDVSIRRLGHQIVLDFPGSQSLSASQLIEASSMYFHIVNEKFSPYHTTYGESVNRFLQNVWNEAVVTKRTEASQIHEIAYRMLHGDSSRPESATPQTDPVKFLLQQGLHLLPPDQPTTSSQVDLGVCKIVRMRGDESGQWHGQMHPLMIVFANYALEGSQLENIRSGYDPSKGNFLSFEVKSSAFSKTASFSPRDQLSSWTSRFAKESILSSPYESDSQGRGWRMAVVLNHTVINAPSLESPLRESGMITGNFSQREVAQLAADLKAGSLTFTPQILSEKNVSPDLGKKERDQGIFASWTALLLVIGAMSLYYRLAGWVASLAVLFNLLIIWAALQNLGAALSLAGIAGIILNIGMAVDANVLVFERIKEEFDRTSNMRASILAGYQKAYSAILDSNITTILAGLILMNFDAGPIKAFAITLIIGIVSSMFTALFVTRYYFLSWVEKKPSRVLKMRHWIRPRKIPFLKYAKSSLILSAIIMITGIGLGWAQKNSLLGMDFTGGFSLNLELDATSPKEAPELLKKAFLQKGASPQDVQIRQLNPSHHLRLLLGTSMDQPGKPFFQMPLESSLEKTTYLFEKNPRIQWVVQTIQETGLSLSPDSLQHLDKHWTVMSGQMSETMQHSAIIGLSLSLLCMFIYIAFRFEFPFAAAATACVLHDVLFTLGLMALLHALGVPVQIDLNTIAALMTIIGYSLNDTLIIFDRIREEMHLYPNRSLRERIHHALNATLSRTLITSITTLLVLIALLCFAGASIFSFALVMTLGVFFGTLSSWLIASPFLLFFYKLYEKGSSKPIHSPGR